MCPSRAAGFAFPNTIKIKSFEFIDFFLMSKATRCNGKDSAAVRRRSFISDLASQLFGHFIYEMKGLD